MDKLKTDDIHFMDEWHFVPNYQSLDGSPIDHLISKGHAASVPVNATAQITYHVDVVRWDPAKSKQSQFYGGTDTTLEKSLAIRKIIHMVGDIHQPLHASEGVQKSHPNGD